MFHHIKQTMLLLCLSFTAVFLFAKPFQVLEETPDYIKVKFTLPEWKLDSVRENNQNWHQISCEMGATFSQEGYPMSKSFSEAIGIPVDGDISIEVISQNRKIVPDVKLYPCKKTNVTDMEVTYTFFQDLQAYRSSSLYPAVFADKGTSAFIGNRNMIPLRLYPFQYMARSKELYVTTEAILLINVRGNKSQSRDWQATTNFIDDASQSFFLNNQTSRLWRKAKEKTNSLSLPKSQSDLINELQLVVDEEGIYKITRSYLIQVMSNMADSLGIQYSWSPESIDPRYLQLRDEYGHVAIHFAGEADGSFDENDYFEFYGDRHYGDTHYQDDYTARNVYTLSISDSFGARLAVENGGLVNSNQTQYIVPDAYEHTVHLEEQYIPDKLGRSWSTFYDYYREDTWFWRKITAPNLEIIPFELQYPKDTTIRTLSTKIALFGLTYIENLPTGQYDHKATIRLNQALINTKSWRDQSEQVFENQDPIPNSYLHHGTNYYYVSMNGDTPMGNREQILLDFIELTYWREYKTSEDYIKFSKPSNRPFGLYQFKVEGFSSNHVSVYKVGSSVFTSLQIEPFTLNGNQPWTITFQDSVVSNDVRYYAVTENQKKVPKEIRVVYPSYWNTSENSADCILLTGRKFVDDPGTLLYKQLWEEQGYQVEIVDVQNIYNEYNGGIKSAESIKEFLTYAYNNWQDPQLKSVVILGDGTDDERDNSISQKYNIVPVKKLWTYKHGATACDNWYGCVVGNDPLSDISISRINIWKSEQIIQVAQKSQTYINQPNFNNLWHGNVILASGGKAEDRNDEFSRQCESIRRNTIPLHYKTSRVYTNTMTVSHDYWGTTNTLIDKINDGAIFLQFMGHGGGRVWADYSLFNFNNVTSLNNQNYPIVSSLACYCSAFDTNGSSSISEALVLQPGKGAIATVGFSGLGYLFDDLDFGYALTEGLFLQDFDNLGDAINYTKAKFYVSTSSSAARQALTQGCALLGDANIKVLKPQKNVIVSTDKDNYAIGDTVKVVATFPQGAIAAQTFVMNTKEITVNNPYDGLVENNTYNFTYRLTGNVNDIYQRKLLVSGFSSQGEFCGSKDISIGRGLISHLNMIPEQPAWNDTVKFTAKLTGITNISTVECLVRTDSTSTQSTWVSLPMHRSESDTTIYQSYTGFPQQIPGKEIFYKYLATTNISTLESRLSSFVVAGAELLMADIQFIAQNQDFGIKVLVRNIGNKPSLPTDIKLYISESELPLVLLKTISFAALDVNSERWSVIPLNRDSLMVDDARFEARVNIPRIFPEWSGQDLNNTLSLRVPLNYHLIDYSGGSISSLDGNLMCEIPSYPISQNRFSMYCINDLESVTANSEPDVYPIILKSGIASIPYEIKTLDSSLVDSVGVFKNGKIKLTFFYSSTDQTTQLNESANTYMIFRWEDAYRKWLIQGGNLSTAEDMVIAEVSREGIYTLMRSLDKIPPSIDVNVQDQEFTEGGYISGSGIVSLILSDANGINIFDDSIKLFLDGNEIPASQWVKTINQNDINRIPIKYQLSLPKGSYSLIVDCKDVTGNKRSRDVKFFVNDKFDVINVANYPNPVLGNTVDPKNAGRTRFTYVLTDDAEDVKIKVYTVSGRLVKTFRNLPTGVGYHEYPRTVYSWDCIDENGFYLANGVYFYKVIAHKGNKTIEKTQKLAITK